MNPIPFVCPICYKYIKIQSLDELEVKWDFDSSYYITNQCCGNFYPTKESVLEILEEYKIAVIFWKFKIAT